MPNLYLDFETKSDVSLPTHGLQRYIRGTEADILMCGYRTDEMKQAKVWVAGRPLPYEFKNIRDFTVYAHNAEFDWTIWNTLGKHYGLPTWRLSQTVDVMALCARYTLPLNLAKAGAVLNCKIQKDSGGKGLIKKICCPPFEYTRAEWDDFIYYAARDVDSMVEIIRSLPADTLSTKEQEYWVMTKRINAIGLPVDYKLSALIGEIMTVFADEQLKFLPDLTDGLITKVTQTARIKTFCHNNGIQIPNVQAETVAKLLEDHENGINLLPAKVYDVLFMRKELSASSTSRYLRLANMHYNGRIYGILVYYGANKTGRYASWDYQIHNMPRAKSKKPYTLISKFKNLSIIEDHSDGNPVLAARKLMRPMIKASKGKLLAVLDYSAIEYILLMWVVDDYAAVHRFAQGLDQYKDMASAIYNIPYDAVVPSQRQFGKALELGCGYGLGGVGFQDNAAGWGIFLSLDESYRAVNLYRTHHPKVPKFWYRSKDMMVNAVLDPGTEYTYKKCTYRVVKDRNHRSWMRLGLPSGRALFYMEPSVMDDKYGPVPTHMGMNPTTKQWQRLKLIPGRITENIIQATARDILCYGKKQMQDNGIKVVASIHDETISEVLPKTDLSILARLMCMKEDWAKDIPLRADGYIAKRYRKD